MKKNPNPWKQQAKERWWVVWVKIWETDTKRFFFSFSSQSHTKTLTWVSNGVNWESLFLLPNQKIHSDIFCLLHPTNDKLGCLYTKNLILSSPQTHAHAHTLTMCECLYLSDVWWHDYPETVNSNILNHS